MSLKIEKLLRQRKTEIVITIALFIFAISLVLLSLGPLQKSLPIEIGGKLGFSLLVALIVRWLTVLFSEAETSVDCDISEYHEAVKAARQRVWIYQTWLPGIERDGTEILYSKASDKRLLLLSFEKSSPIYARVKGRGMKVATAQHNSAGSVKPLVMSGQIDCIRFNYGHHPAWIAVIDSLVFWGPTPVDLDSQAIEFLFHKHSAASPEGVFWVNQFKVIWDRHSHSFDEEKKYNPELLDLP
jgi:hypothetical protein